MVDKKGEKEPQVESTKQYTAQSVEEKDSNRTLAEDVILSFITAIKFTQLYPETNPAIQRSIEKVIQKLTDFTSKEDSLIFLVRKKFIFFKKKALLPKKGDINKLALKLYLLHVQEISFSRQTTDQEIRDFIYLLGQKVEDIKKEGGLIDLLKNHNINNINIQLAKKIKVVKDKEGKELDTEDIEPDEMEEIELKLKDFNENIDFFQNIFLSVSHLESRHRNMLLGMLDDSENFAELLLEISSQAIPLGGQNKVEAQVEFIQNALNNLSEYIKDLDPSEQEKLFRKLSKVILSLKKEIKEDLIQQKMLPSLHKGSLESKILSYFPAIDLVGALTTRIKLHSGASSIIYDALDNLTLPHEKRNSIIELIKQKLQLERKMSKEFEELFKNIPLPDTEKETPKRIEFPDVSYEFGPDEEVFVESKVRQYKETPKKYVIIPTLLDLLELVENYTSYCAIMDRLEEKIQLFITKLDLGSVIKIVITLKAEEKKRRAATEFWERINLVLENISSPEIINNLLDSVMDFKEDSEEYQQILRLTDALGTIAVENLLERLITEESMIVRKKILGIFIALGRDYLEVLGEQINHEAWYVVRNIVHILGHYGSDALQYLKKAMNHPDFRVKKELIISLSLIQNEEAINLIVTFLQDRDSRIQEAAISQLGKFSTQKSVTHLVNILQNTKYHKKNPTLILAIIKALAQIRAKEALPQLRIFSRKRWILNRFWRASAWQIRRKANIAIKHIEKI